MKKSLVIAIVFIFIMALLVSCGDSAETPKDNGGAASDVKGETINTEKFSVLKIDGWEYMEVDGGFQIYKASGEILQIQILGNNVTEEDDKALLEAFANNYSGTALIQVDLLGLKFWMTSADVSGVKQSYYSTVKNGEQVKIQATGLTYDENSDIKAMVDSIVFN